jgi:hypothetical protein
MWFIIEDLRETKIATPIFLEWCFVQRVKKCFFYFLPADSQRVKKDAN